MSTLFTGLQFRITGSFSIGKKAMRTLLRDNGGEVGENEEKRCTHVVADDLTSEKAQWAQKEKIPVVTEQWVTESIQAKKIVKEKKYYLSGAPAQEEEKKQEKNGKRKHESSSSSSDSSDSSDSDSDSDDEKQEKTPKKIAKTTATAGPSAASAASTPAASPTNATNGSSNNGSTKKQPKTPNVPFQRVKLGDAPDLPEQMRDNSFSVERAGAFGALAQSKLGVTRGKGFRHEKTKGKRGNYRGALDMEVRSIKFD